MAPRIDTVQKLGPHGRTVFITGPIGGWNPGVLAAVFTVVVSQIEPNGASAVVAIGESRHTYEYDDPGTEWQATARVISEGARGFSVGDATVTAWATYADSDGGGWPYQWTLPVRLENS
ncbi:MAG TPA: hypothetical protein VGL44_02695 [Gaiellales bacterium]